MTCAGCIWDNGARYTAIHGHAMTYCAGRCNYVQDVGCEVFTLDHGPLFTPNPLPRFWPVYLAATQHKERAA